MSRGLGCHGPSSNGSGPSSPNLSKESVALAAYASNPETWYTASRDKKGHSSSLRVNIPVGVMQSLAELVASRRFPELRTPADCLRDALGRWLEWMTNEGGAEELATTSALYKINLDFDRMAELREFNQNTVLNVERELREARSAEQIAMARARAEAARGQLTDEYYRFEVEQLISRYSK